MNFRISDIVLVPGDSEQVLTQKIAFLLNIAPEDILSVKIVRKSIDARRNRQPYFVYIVDISVGENIRLTPENCKGVKIKPILESQKPFCLAIKNKPQKKPVIIGCGPAGLFAALALMERGIPSVLLERGKPVPERVSDVNAFWENGVLNTESNVHFGEGGAGTFSDGKLTSRARNPNTVRIKKTLVDAGASSDILTSAKPHIGTDRLRKVVVNLRTRLTEMGCEMHFQSHVTDFMTIQGKVKGVVVNGKKEIKTDHVILAIGQSADDTYLKLNECGVCLAPKPFAIGLRVEHPQALINRIQYGKWHDHPDLPPAEYFMTAKLSAINRSVYTFCMCPGGVVIGCSPVAGTVVTNGMSDYNRDGYFANAAVVVNVSPWDFMDVGDTAFMGLEFRRRWEQKAFNMGGKNYHAPAQRLIDFLENSEGRLPDATSFLPGLKSAPLRETLPRFAIEALCLAFYQFERKMRGFITEDAVLIGVETRTSSPVRILRHPDGQSVSTSGLYPCGEGAGYAGGIISSALDGIRAAESLLSWV